jgi:hypothetical protein
MAKKLFDLDPAEVSLVGKGANKKRFLVYKSGERVMPANIETLLKKADAKTIAHIEKILKNAPPSNSGMTSEDLPPKPDSATFKDDAQVQAAMKAAARILAPHKDKLSSDHMKTMSHDLGINTGEGQAAVKPEAEGPGGGNEPTVAGKAQMAIPENVKEEHHAAALDMAQKAYSSHLEKMGYRKYDDQQPTQKSKEKENDDDDGGDDVSKSLKDFDLSKVPAAVREPLEAIFKSNQELVKKNETLSSQLAEEQDRRKQKEYVEKAQGFKHLGANTEELATTLKTIASRDPEAAAKVESVLKAADAQIKAGGALYGELGSRISKADAGSPEGQMKAMVEAHVAKSDGKQSKEEIADHLFRTNKEYKRLYSEYMNNHPGMKGNS